MSISWDLEVKDHVSAPANAAAAAMGHAASAAQGLHEHVGHLHEGFEGLVPEIAAGEIAAEALKSAFEFLVDSGKELIATAIEASERVIKLTEVFGALSGGGEEAGKAIFDMTRDLAKQLPQSEATVQSWARSLMAAGVTDMSKLQASLRATAGAEALVEGGGERVRNLLAKLNEASEKGTKIRFNMAQLAGTGLTETDLLKQLGMTPRTFELAKKQGTITGTAIADAMTRALGEKAAGPLEGQMNELSTIVTKAKDAFTRLLEGVDIKPLVAGIREFFSVFDDANPSGKLIKTLIVGALNEVFTIAGKVFSFLKTAFLQLIIWGLQAAIFLNPLVRHFQEWFEKVHGAQILMQALKGIGIMLGVLATAMGIVIALGLAVNVAMVAAAAAIVGAVGWIIGLVPKAGEALGDLAYNAVQAAKGFIDGFVNGIKNGVGLVVDAVKNMGHSAWNAIKGVLGIASPSKVMMQIGMQTSEGFAQGMAGNDNVEESASRMGSSAVSAASRVGGGSSVSQVFHIDVHIDAGRAATPTQLRTIVEEEFASLANRLSNMAGAAPSAA